MRATAMPGSSRGTIVPPDQEASVGDEVLRTLVAASERPQQRRRLIHILVFAQFLLTLATIPGYVSPELQPTLLGVLAAALVVDLLAFITSRLFNNTVGAAYLLVFGGALVIAAQMLVQALAGNPLGTAQAALFFLAIILEASLLFAPEVALTTALVTGLLTIGALFLAFAIARTMPNSEAYLLVVYTLGVLALASLIAWLIAQFLFESAAEAHKSQNLRFAQAQLAAANARAVQQQQRLEEGIRALQTTIARMLTGDYKARVAPVPGDLADLMRSFNLLLEHFQSQLELEPANASPAETIRQMLELISVIAEGGLYTPSMEDYAGTPLGAVMQALVHLHTRSARRTVKIQELAGDVAGAVQTGLEGLTTTAADMTEATQLAGRLVSAINARLPIVKTAHEVVVRARHAMDALLPAEVRQAATDAIQRDLEGVSAQDVAHFLGLDLREDLEGLPDILESELTGEFEALPARDGPDAAIPPLTVPLPVLTEETRKAARHGARARGAEDAQAQLLELWLLLGQLGANLAQEYRTLRYLSRELSKLSRSVRSAEAGVVHGMASLDAARETLKQWQQIAGSNPTPNPVEHDVPPFAGGRHGGPASGPIPGPLSGAPGVPASSRPLPPLSAAAAAMPGSDALYGTEADTLPVEVTPPGGWLNAGDLIDPTLRADGGGGASPAGDEDRPRAGRERGR
jgi:hypothetical protein